MTQSNIPEGATHIRVHMREAYFYRVSNIVEVFVELRNRFEPCIDKDNIDHWLNLLIPITKPFKEKPYLHLSCNGFAIPDIVYDKIFEILCHKTVELADPIVIIFANGAEVVVESEGLIPFSGKKVDYFKIIKCSGDLEAFVFNNVPVPPSVRPYNAFTAELDKVIQLRGLELLNAMQRKIEASEGIPIEWLNELMDFHGVSV